MSKIEAFWVNATAFEVARVMAGETVEARFRDIETDPWCSPRDLTGCKAVGDGKLRWFTLTSSWRYCQVYREPSWWTDKPDPGPGCRLLEKFPDEELKPGDEYFDRPTGRWHLSGHAKTQQQQLTETWYRRRIEPVEATEAPGPAKVRVDLALAAMRHKANCDAFQRAEDAVDESKRLLFDTFVAAQKTDVVVKIDGEHYHFWLNEITPRFRKIEVL